MHPSLFRPGNLPASSVDTRLVYLGHGTLKDLAALEGVDLRGALALMDFDCGSNWLRFLRFGLRGFLFIGQSRYTSAEAALKVHDSEVAVPRFFVTAADGAGPSLSSPCPRRGFSSPRPASWL